MAEVVCSPNASTAFQFLVSKGLTDFQAAAVIGNLQWESGLDPTKAVLDTNGKMSRGIAMWQPPRWQNLIASSGGQDPMALDTQLDFLWHELTSGGFGLAQLHASTSVEDATIIFQDLFEKPNKALAHTDKRIALAKSALMSCPLVRAPAQKTSVALDVMLGAVIAAGLFGAVKLLKHKDEPRRESVAPAPAPSPEPVFYRPEPDWEP